MEKLTDGADAISIYMTCPDEKSASDIAQNLLGQNLIACANILPAVRSLYKWDGDIQDDAECVVIMKARKADFPAIERTVIEQHPYDVPCLIAWPIVEGHAPYLEWLMGEKQ